MAEVKFKGESVQTIGNIPEIGSKAPPFTLTENDLSDVTLDDFGGTNIVMNVFPSIDTSVCAISVRKFNEFAASLEGTRVLCISRDLPFAQQRFCGAEGIDRVTMLSELRSSIFGEHYGLRMTNGPLAGLFARAVIVIDGKGEVTYVQLVPEITDEPEYDEVIEFLKRDK